jgi:hypothetical protein
MAFSIGTLSGRAPAAAFALVNIKYWRIFNRIFEKQKSA